MNYTEYLQSLEWRRQRRGALRRAHHECQKCGATTDLQVHHLTCERLGNELPDDLVVLCDDCHRETHGLPPDVLRSAAYGSMTRAGSARAEETLRRIAMGQPVE